MEFLIDRYHFFDKKIINEQTTEQHNVDWKSILTERKKEFPNHCFIVIEQDQPLMIDTVLFSYIKIEKTKKSIQINLDTSIKEDNINLYILQLNQREQHLIINTCGNFPVKIFHENITCQKGYSLLEIVNKNKLSYYSTYNNLTTQLLHQEISIHNYDEINFYSIQKSQSSVKNKIDIQASVYKSSISNIFVLSNIEHKQLKDDTIEVIHQGDDAKSEINYLSLNGGKNISQINSVVLKETNNSETHQHIKHILLNENAQSYSKPNLMISNPLVVASHGNSIGSFNPENLFYLNQKGITTENARKIIAQSYLQDFCDKTDYSNQLISYLLGETK